MTDLHRLVGSLQQRGAGLTLDTTDLCFLIVLRDRADRAALASLEEEILYDVYEQVCDLTDPGAGQVRKRATHALQRLRQQRLLGRVDGAGLVRAGEYALTRLATAIVDFFLADEALTRDSLTILTRTLASHYHGRIEYPDASQLAPSRKAKVTRLVKNA
jgi:chromosome partition protein MukF